jgi:DNA-directed RNA polymerase subunit H
LGGDVIKNRKRGSFVEDQTPEERKALILMKLRGYKLIKREEQEDTIKFIVKLRKGNRAVILCMPNRKVVGVAFVRNLRKLMDETGVEKGVIVANARYTWAAKREAKKYGIELIPKVFPSFNIFKHKLIPKHEILPPEKAKDLLEKYHIEPHQLPRIKTSDIAVIAVGAKPGDIIKVARKSLTSGKHIAYRLVITDPKEKIRL